MSDSVVGASDGGRSDSGREDYSGVWTVRKPHDSDFERWRALYQGYADFYGANQPDSSADLVWSWIQDPDHEVKCLLVGNDAGYIVGIAHYRPFARPLSAAIGCYLDDLFVDPAVRGSGAADALLKELKILARDNGWTVVRWITDDNNHRARAKYDQYAVRTMWVTYDMAPA